MSTTGEPDPAVAGEHERFETLLVELSSGFINLAPGDVDLEISDALRRVCEILALDFALVWQFDAERPGLVVPTHSHPSLEVLLLNVPLEQSLYPWVVAQITEGRAVVMSRLDDLPEEAATDRASARRAGIKSNVTIPLLAGGAPPLGALVCNTARTERTWPNRVVSRLRLIAEVFTNALTRKRADLAQRVSEIRLKSAADLAGLAFYEIDYRNGSLYVDARFRELFGLLPGQEHGLGPLEYWIEHLHPDDRPRLMELRQALHDGRREQLREEYRFLHPDRGQIWIHHVSGVAERDANGRAARTFGVFRDITQRKLAEEALKRSFAEIELLKDRLLAESEYLKAEVKVAHGQSEIIGSSAAIKKVLHQAEQVAATDATVLVVGETGTGKELLAQAIHRLSPRARQVMVKVNCAALPSGLVESELFGREKGAFTGALARQVGRFEVADGSTLFLDEVGELPADVQVKLLRVLQEGEFERLGSPHTVKVNLRVIAATNRDLAEEVRKGRFREDLYYRLNVFPIRMPPLRERPEDIPHLVWVFLEECSSRMGKKITQVPRTTMEVLQQQAWPGNVRELRNVIERAAILSAGDTLWVPVVSDAAPAAAARQTLADSERDLILLALERTRWRIKGPRGAATALGLNPSTLRSRMKKLGIRPPEADGRGLA